MKDPEKKSSSQQRREREHRQYVEAMRARRKAWEKAMEENSQANFAELMAKIELNTAELKAKLESSLTEQVRRTAEELSRSLTQAMGAMAHSVATTVTAHVDESLVDMAQDLNQAVQRERLGWTAAREGMDAQLGRSEERRSELTQRLDNLEERVRRLEEGDSAA